MMSTSLLLLGLFFAGTSAYLPLLGEADHPLLYWGPQHLLKLLDPNNTSFMKCMQSPKGMVAATKLSDAQRCVLHLEQPADVDPVGLCSAYETFTQCFHEIVIQVAETCGYSIDETRFLNNAVDNNKDILESLCEDNGEKLMSYMTFGGFDCANTKRTELLECAEQNKIMGEPRYDSEGCMSATEFMDCAVREIGSCSENAGEALRKVSEDALEDLCKDEEIGSVGQFPYGFDDDDDDDSSEEHEGPNRRMGRGKHQMMERQTELMEEMNKSLKTIITILNNHQQLLEKIAEK